MPQHIHKVKYGNTERLSFATIKDTLDIPYLIALQKDSYQQFITEGTDSRWKESPSTTSRSARTATLLTLCRSR